MDTGVWHALKAAGRRVVLGLVLLGLSAQPSGAMPPILPEDETARAMGVGGSVPSLADQYEGEAPAGAMPAGGSEAGQKTGMEVAEEEDPAQHDERLSEASEDRHGSLMSQVLSGWSHRIEIAASGTEGNARTGTFRGAFSATRSTELTKASFSMSYQYGTQDSSVVQERFVTSGRLDRLMKESRWRSFLTGSFETDRFRDWDIRLTGGGGFGYQLVKDEKTDLLARGGLSLAQDIGGLDESVRSEAILGLDLTRTISERQKIVGAVDFLPTIGELDQFRLNARVSWEILLDPESRLSLRIGGENRYDTTARAGARRNDTSYYAGIAVEF